MANYMDEARLEELWGLIKEQDEAVAALVSARAQIATGTYKGTGKAGESNKKSLTFGFVPKLVFIQSSGTDPHYTGIYISGQAHLGGFTIKASGTGGQINSFCCDASVSGTKLSWYDDYSNAYWQLNVSGSTYYYVAIG